MGNVDKRAWLGTAMKGSFSRLERRKVVERRNIRREVEVGKDEKICNIIGVRIFIGSNSQSLARANVSFEVTSMHDMSVAANFFSFCGVENRFSLN